MEKILITPLIGIGDTLMTTPALRLLKTHFPDWHITCLTISQSNWEILKGNPFINELHYYPLKTVGFLNGSVHIIKKYFGRYSTSLTFYPSNRASYNLFALMSGASRRIGHTYLHDNTMQLNWLKNKTVPEDPSKHCVYQNVRLLSFFGVPLKESDIPAMDIFLTQEEKNIGQEFRNKISSKTVIGVHAGTSTFKNQDKRRWPKEYFVELMNRFPDFHFILFGTKEERTVNQFIYSKISNPKNLTIIDDRPLRETVAIIGNCNGFVSNDSGLMHIAAAMKIPTVALLGPTNPRFIHPWGTTYDLARTDIECSPCFYYSPKPLKCIRHINFKCMSDLSVDIVYGKLSTIVTFSKP
jgi:lipopolysaccharide heptosyltransferase II